MKILHTADWHLGDRLGRIDRTSELQAAVERVAAVCLEHQVDVLLVAGDIFSELARPDTLRESVEHLARVFLPFLIRGGTILALTGNHDNENFCQTLRHVMNLAAPSAVEEGQTLPAGRFYLASGPTWLRLVDGAGFPVQFVLLPYPTPTRYLDDRTRRYPSLEEKNRALHAACLARLGQMRAHPSFEATRPSVLAAHLQVDGAVLPNLFRMTEQESIVFSLEDMPADWAYVALGHIHHPQALRNQSHVRYCGSLARLDLGEWKDQKGMVIFEIGPEGRKGEPLWVPLPARPIYEVIVTSPSVELPRLPERFPDAAEALVRIQVVYEAGKDVLNDVLARLEEIFPYWYDRTWSEAGALPAVAADRPTVNPGQGLRDTVLGYLGAQWDDHRDRDELLKLAESLIEEEEAAR